MNPRPFAALFLLLLAAAGCSTAPTPTHTGFISDYSMLEKTTPARMEYISPRLREYNTYLVDPIEFKLPPQRLTEQEQAQVAEHFRTRIIETLQKRGLAVVEDPAAGVARLRIALTDVAQSTWWMKIHPGARLAGAGTGGAAMEAEIIDASTREQLAAAVLASPGNQFDLTAFSTVADVKNAIDAWAVDAGRRLDQLRADPAATSSPTAAWTSTP